MSIHVIRHGLSEANNRNNIGTLAFAAKDAPLMGLGRDQARDRAKTLFADYGIDAKITPAATSELLRTQETAREMGFQVLRPYALLNEVEHGIEGSELRAMLDDGILPDAALRSAEAILEQPPDETVWVAHGLVIAGLSQALGVRDKFERLVPQFCEVRELPIGLE